MDIDISSSFSWCFVFLILQTSIINYMIIDWQTFCLILREFRKLKLKLKYRKFMRNFFSKQIIFPTSSSSCQVACNSFRWNMLHGDHSVVQWFADKGFVYFPWQKIYSSTFDLLLLGLINYEIAASDLSENVLLGMCWITNDWGDHWLCSVRNNQQAWASIYIQDTN